MDSRQPVWSAAQTRCAWGKRSYTICLEVRIPASADGALDLEAPGRCEHHQDLKVLLDRVKAVLHPGTNEQD